MSNLAELSILSNVTPTMQTIASNTQNAADSNSVSTNINQAMSTTIMYEYNSKDPLNTGCIMPSQLGAPISRFVTPMSIKTDASGVETNSIETNSNTNDEDLADITSDTDSSNELYGIDGLRLDEEDKIRYISMIDNNLANTMTRSMLLNKSKTNIANIQAPMHQAQTDNIQAPMHQAQIDNIPLFMQYDNIYGAITISQIAKQVIGHPYFQRLHHIKQLGPLHFKFPYAGHARYEHSIGVAYLARYVGTILKGKHKNITNKEILCLELAALCHDLGHGAYSHSFDHLLRDIGFKHKTAHHEVRSQILVRYLIESLLKVAGTSKSTLVNATSKSTLVNGTSKSTLVNATSGLHQYLDEDAIRLVQYFIDPDRYTELYPGEEAPKFTPGLEQIVSNPVHKLDVDKMDYLLRDAQALRFDLTISGELDIKGLLSRSQIVVDDTENTRSHIWMFHIRDQGTVYDLICRRFIFYNNYYLHPHVNALNCMLTDALQIVDRVYNFSQCVKLETVEDADAFVKLTDDYLLELILNSNDDRILEAKKLISRIVNKKGWYKHLGDFVTSVENLDETTYAELPWEIFTDKSTPTNLLPKIRYHQNGIPINPRDVKFTRRLYLKTEDH